MLIHKTQSVNYQEDIVDLLCEMDTWLMNQSREKLKADRFGADICISMNDFKLIVRYKKILVDKANNDRCLCQYQVEEIISRIKQILNRNQTI